MLEMHGNDTNQRNVRDKDRSLWGSRSDICILLLGDNPQISLGEMLLLRAWSVALQSQRSLLLSAMCKATARCRWTSARMQHDALWPQKSGSSSSNFKIAPLRMDECVSVFNDNRICVYWHGIGRLCATPLFQRHVHSVYLRHR